MKFPAVVLLAVVCACSIQQLQAQEVTPEPQEEVFPAIEEVEVAEEPTVYMRVERMPCFPKCDLLGEEERVVCHETELINFISKNVRYPQVAKEEGIAGTVVVSYVISPAGKVENAKVVRSVHPLLDEEALRVIRALPLHIPGKQRGKKVHVQYNVPIQFAVK